jgi:hypothetical protein
MRLIYAPLPHANEWLLMRMYSWGTYSDAMGTHCNAHSNNLVATNPSPGNRQPSPAQMIDIIVAP